MIARHSGAIVNVASVNGMPAEHGVVVERVSWARHGSGFTRSFEEQVAWLAMECSKTAVENLMRTSWRSVGNILERVAARLVKPACSSPTCAGSGSTRSPTAVASATWWWSSTTTRSPGLGG